MTMENEEKLTPEEEEAIKEYLGAAPLPEEKHNVHSFLNKVASSLDTTKTGNLDATEIGLPRLNLRTIKDMSLIASKLMNNNELAEYYRLKGEILTSTSLSKNATLINLAVIQKRQIEDQTPEPRKQNSGWFKKKDDPLNQGPQLNQ